MTELNKAEQELVEKIAKRVNDSRCEVCNDCGASISTDNPDTVAREIVTFLKEAGFVKIKDIQKIMKEAPDLRSLERELANYLAEKEGIGWQSPE